MIDYKKNAALAAMPLIQKGMIVGMGAGSTISHLAHALTNNQELVDTLIFLPASHETAEILQRLQFKIGAAGDFEKIDLYFDSCDQLDRNLNALKSGGGIHTSEKIIATMANTFVLLADSGKLVSELNNTFPLVLEVIPAAAGKVIYQIRKQFSTATFLTRMDDDHPLLTERNNILIDCKFEILPPLEELDKIKMIAGIVDHSLFYQIASKAIIAGPDGIEIFSRG